MFPESGPPCPVHYNCWEAVYFDHNLPELKEVATRAGDLGADWFVLDDGWFGSRDDDSQALSDSEVNPRKYPDGLAPLIWHVHVLGMKFGIWFEPEMINPNSNIFRAHPDWTSGGEDQILGRQQMVLNMALPDEQHQQRPFEDHHQEDDDQCRGNRQRDVDLAHHQIIEPAPDITGYSAIGGADYQCHGVAHEADSPQKNVSNNQSNKEFKLYYDIDN